MNEQEIENFIRARNYSIETIEYAWFSSKEKIVSLIHQIYPSDLEKIKNLLTTVDIFEEIIYEMIVEKDFGIENIPTEISLKIHEKDLFQNKLNLLKEWYIDLLALLNSTGSEYTESKSPGKLWNDYEEMNYEFRYSNDANYKLAKQEHKFPDWKKNNNHPIIYSYTHIFTEMYRMRNQVTHNIGAKAGRSRIPIKRDHILNNNIPGNSITLSNTITLSIYGYVELLETLDNSKIIHNSGTSMTSKSHVYKKIY